MLSVHCSVEMPASFTCFFVDATFSTSCCEFALGNCRVQSVSAPDSRFSVWMLVIPAPIRLDPFQSNGNSIQVQFNGLQSNRIQSNDSNQVGSVPMSSNSIGLDQVSLNCDGFNAGSSNSNQSNTMDSSQMPSPVH